MAGTMAGRRTGENWLSARSVATAKDGSHADGGGLYLDVRGTARSWLYRFQMAGRRREMGLGPATVYGLAEARQRRDAARRLVVQGIDPIAHRRTPAQPAARLWGAAVDDYIATHQTAWKTDAQAAQWAQSLKDHGPDRTLPVAAVTTPVVVEVLKRLWTGKTETATRVRGRIERVWNAEKVAGHVHGENPARWRGHLENLLPKPSKVTKPKHHAAMPYGDVPAFVVALRARKGLSARALEFAILTAARTSEVTGAQWGEFDLKAKLWTVPADRMKAGREHLVPLSDAAVEILRALPRKVPPFALSENAMLYLLQRDPPKGLGRPYTVHGFRSSFRDWTAETTATPREVAEMALAHTIPDKAEAAYRRGHLIDKRRELMDAWATYLA